MSNAEAGFGNPEVPEDDVEMSFFDHLRELRKRLVLSIIGILPGVVVGWIFKEELLDLLLAPLVTAYNSLGLGQPEIHFANPIDPFVAYLKIAVVAGAMLCAPWLFYQLWAFISPGLYRREKLMAIPFVIASTGCFLGGAAFGYIIVFPLGFETFLDFAGMMPSENINLRPTLMITEYLSFSTRLLLAFGVVFEVPVVVTFLAVARIVHWKQLAAFGRWWILCATFLAAFLTPPDVASQMMMLVPLVVLYFISVGIAAIIQFRDPAPGSVTEDGFER